MPILPASCLRSPYFLTQAGHVPVSRLTGEHFNRNLLKTALFVDGAPLQTIVTINVTKNVFYE